MNYEFCLRTDPGLAREGRAGADRKGTARTASLGGKVCRRGRGPRGAEGV